ncbi:MAG: DNA translocase FtsK, partial [Bacteroidales bacterium]|nr:DNA translocase FtsK [Bacteroidales bacterium]
LQCAFVDTDEVERINEYIKGQQGYSSALFLPEYNGDGEGGQDPVEQLRDRDPLFEEVARMIVSSQNGSTSNIQRRMNLGYNRAGRLMDQMEAAGIVGPAQGSKPREIYVQDEAELNVILEGLK